MRLVALVSVKGLYKIKLLINKFSFDENLKLVADCR